MVLGRLETLAILALLAPTAGAAERGRSKHPFFGLESPEIPFILRACNPRLPAGGAERNDSEKNTNKNKGRRTDGCRQTKSSGCVPQPRPQAKVPVTIFLINGVKLQGVITWFDNFCVLLRRDGQSQLVYKHAISHHHAGRADQSLRGRRLTADPPEDDAGIPARDPRETARAAMRAYVLHPDFKADRTRRPPDRALAEAVALAAALPDLAVAGAEVVRVARAQPGLLFGSGKVADLKATFHARDVGLVLVDGPVSPVQQRNLEKEWGVKLLDRTGLILEIFADRARTREGVMQVELAALSYQRTRLVRAWTHLERQRGGFGFVGGPGGDPDRGRPPRHRRSGHPHQAPARTAS